MKIRWSISTLMILLVLNGLLAPMTFGQDGAGEKAAAIVEKAAEQGTAVVEKATEAVAEKVAETAEGEAKEEAEAPKSRLAGTFWALIPPFIAIILALITKEVYSSLFIGILVGGMFAALPACGTDGCVWSWFLGVIDHIINDGLIEAVKASAGVFIFLVILGVLVALINKTGAANAFGEWAKTHVKSRIGAMLATFLLGVLIFIDDYFNCLTVGSVMLPVTDSHRISRAKLAYLIDATAAPICMIAPISSWAAAVSEYAEGTDYSGLELFCRAIPYNFYSLLTFVFIIGITLLKVDYGPMAKHEKNALEKGDLFTSGTEVDNGVRPLANAKGRVFDMLVPIVLLIIVCVLALIYVGGFHSTLDDGTKKGFIAAFSDTDATVGLPWGGLIVLFVTILYLWIRRVIPIRDAMKAIPDGFCAMVPAMLILTFAATLKNMTGLLEAKEYIARIMETSAGRLDKFLPAVIFFVACVLSFATGTSWGTFGILIPIVVHIFPATSPLLFIGMSACLAGAVCGDHCSPISDTTIMSSAGARCEHINHVQTQLPYAITVAAVSFVSFLLAGFIHNWFVVFPISVVMMVAVIFLAKKLIYKE